MRRLSLLSAMIMGFAAGSLAPLYGQEPQSQPQRPPSDATRSAAGDDLAHTNYAFIPLDQQSQTPTFTQSLSEIKLPPEIASPLQIVRPRSDLSNQSAYEELARFALMTGEVAPVGSEIRAHTNYQFLANADRPPGIFLAVLKNNTPAEIKARYGLTDSEGGGLIVIVGAYDYPTADSDLATFSQQFTLPPCSIQNKCLQIVKVVPDKTPRDTDPQVPDCGWSGEAALDLQWAHAIAPQAKLVLVEAASSGKDKMIAAVDKATEIAETAGGGIVSLSWSYDEFPGEEAYDQHFRQHDNVLYFAASGDKAATVEYPSASPFVVSVGGTKVLRDANNKILIEEAWDSTGGGNSNREPRPTVQAIWRTRQARTELRLISRALQG